MCREKHGCPGAVHVGQCDLKTGEEARGAVMNCNAEGAQISRCKVSSPCGRDFLVRALGGLNPGLGLVPQITRILSSVNSSREKHPEQRVDTAPGRCGKAVRVEALTVVPRLLRELSRVLTGACQVSGITGC